MLIKNKEHIEKTTQSASASSDCFAECYAFNHTQEMFVWSTNVKLWHCTFCAINWSHELMKALCNIFKIFTY